MRDLTNSRLYCLMFFRVNFHWVGRVGVCGVHAVSGQRILIDFWLMNEGQGVSIISQL